MKDHISRRFERLGSGHFQPPTILDLVRYATPLPRPEAKYFGNYGARGITVCSRWDSFHAFVDDIGPKPTPAHTIERIDNAGNYEPGNCRWATRAEQSKNRRNNRFIEVGGIAMVFSDAAREVGVEYSTLRVRLNRGVVPSEALMAPALQTIELEGEAIELLKAARDVGIDPNLVRMRLKHGWTARDALYRPVRRYKTGPR